VFKTDREQSGSTDEAKSQFFNGLIDRQKINYPSTIIKKKNSTESVGPASACNSCDLRLAALHNLPVREVNITIRPFYAIPVIFFSSSLPFKCTISDDE
jgi:hypothetical protein